MQSRDLTFLAVAVGDVGKKRGTHATDKLMTVVGPLHRRKVRGQILVAGASSRPADLLSALSDSTTKVYEAVDQTMTKVRGNAK